MPHRLRRPLPAFGFAALALILPPATASTPHGVRVLATASPAAVNHPERPPANAADYVGVRERAATLALRMVGTPYRWGGESPSGFDCSGLVRWAYGRVGIDVPHSSYALYGIGRTVPRARLETGDVLFFSGLGHVGLYLGGGRMVHAPYSGKRVEIVNLAASSYGRRLVGARRVAPF